MGVAISDLLIKEEIKFDELFNKVIVIDAFNILYQFITTIRQYDGSPLTDSKGRITSHLSGLLYRCTNLMKKNIKLVFVFDGESPELKKAEQERRNKLKEEALHKYEVAVEAKDTEAMKKYASRTARLSNEMIEEAKTLLGYMGIPVVQAPGEGEAQCSYMVKKGDAYAVGSQDFDVLLFGAPRVIRNLTFSRKRKVPSKLSYTSTSLECIELDKNLNQLGIDFEQLIVLGMLVGTDYNIGGIKGIGPKKAIQIVKQYKKDFEKLFKDLKWDEHFKTPWQEVFMIFKKADVTDNYKLEWSNPDINAIKKMLVDDFEFSEERIGKVLLDLKKRVNVQKGLSEFF